MWSWRRGSSSKIRSASIAAIRAVSSPEPSGRVPAITTASPTTQPDGISLSRISRSPCRGSRATVIAELLAAPWICVAPWRMAPRPISSGSLSTFSGPRSANSIRAETSACTGSMGVPISSRLPGAVTTVSTFNAVSTSVAKRSVPFTRTQSREVRNSPSTLTVSPSGMRTRLSSSGTSPSRHVDGEDHSPDATATCDAASAAARFMAAKCSA